MTCDGQASRDAAAIIVSTQENQIADKEFMAVRAAGDFSSELIDDILKDPTAIWRMSSAVNSKTLFDLDSSMKEVIIGAYTEGFSLVFRVFVALIGLNLYVTLLPRDNDNVSHHDLLTRNAR